MLDAKAYVFDMDGTLAWLPVRWAEVRTKLRLMLNNTQEFSPVFATIEAIVAEKPELKGEILGEIDRFELEALPGARVSEGTVEVLTKLSEKAKLTLVTLQGRRACMEVLRRFDIDRFFMRYFTREDSLDRATQIRMALKAMNSEEGDAVFVGDRINDLNAAKAVGVRFVMIRDQEDNPGAETIYRNMADFLASLDP